ncbi:MAG: hypothetical protein E2P04_01470 [Acidobacteria bacterium]|nr:MAG: hypothetical protein E2P04_01470 [Acidobacteriota bacterium]
MARRQAGGQAQTGLPFPRFLGQGQPGGVVSGPSALALRREQRQALMERLQSDGARIAAHYGLTCRGIVAERPGVVGHYGICYEDGLIKIRLQHATRGTPLKYSSLVSTLCHELAHLKFFDHQEGFRRFYARLLAWARAQGIYRPRGVASAPECSLTPAERREILHSFRAALDGSAPSPAAEPPARGQLTLFPDGAS